jgi:6-phosphogluconolactonase
MAGAERRKYMKLKQWSHNLLAVTAAIGAGVGLVSCGQSNTIDYLYATSAKNNPGQINVYRVDSQSGALTQIPDSPYNVGRDPVALVIGTFQPTSSSTVTNLYVANRTDNTVIQIGIGSDAKLYPANTINPTGSEPVALALSNGYLYVVENLQPNFTDLNPGPGALVVYKLGSDGTLTGTPVPQTVGGVTQNYIPLNFTPTGVNVTADGQHLFVTDQLEGGTTCTGSGSQASSGAVEAFTIAGAASSSTFTPTGTVTAAPGSPFCAGTTPSAITSHPYSTFVYVTDSTQNEVLSYQVNTSAGSATFGALTPLPTPPVTTGSFPAGVVVDPTGRYVYVANKVGDSVSGYAVNLGTGALSSLSTGGSFTVGTQPTCLIVEPALGRFLYTADFEGNDVSGVSINTDTGALAGTQNSPYNTTGLTTCVAAVQHGNHPVIKVQNTAS